MTESTLRERYFARFAEYVASPDELHLAAIADLGRELVHASVQLEEVAEIQHEAVERLAADPPAHLTVQSVSRRMAQALTELLMAFGLEFRRRREQLDRMTAALQLSTDCLVVVDGDCRVIDMNPAFVKLQGVEDRRDLIGKYVFDFFVPAQRSTAEEALTTVADIGRIEAREFEMVTLDGRHVHVELSASAMGEAADRSAGAVAIVRDISERKLDEKRRTRRQSQVVRSGTYHAVGELAAGVAHEINNPLSGVLTYAFLLNERISTLPQNVQQQLEDFPEHLERIKVAAERCRSIAENLLTFARQTDKQKRQVELIEVWKRTLELIGFQLRKHQVEVLCEIPAGLTVWGNLSQLQQVLTNVVLNSVQAMGEQGGRVTLRAAGGDARVVLTVADTGPGIPVERVPRIFEPFFTTKPPGRGTGLGLSIVYGIVQNHGGEVTADSVEGQGTTIRVTLLRKPPPAPNPT